MQVTGNQFKKFLKHFDITQDEAAKSLKVSRQTVNNWCKQAFLDDSVLQIVKTSYPRFDEYLSGNGTQNEYEFGSELKEVAEPEIEYGAHKSDLRILIEQNAQLVKNNTKLVDTITRLSEELITLNREAKNGPARGDVKCADVG